MAAGRLAERVAADFESLWDNAKPQENGSYSKQWTREDRTIYFSDDVDVILRLARAFGLVEFIANVNEVPIFIRRVVG